jgi:hypothetical protein
MLTVIGSETKTYEFVVEDEREAAVEAFVEKYGFYPQAIESETDAYCIIGPCEACGKPIFEGDKYGTDPDGDHPCHVECVE